jgi:exonuclease SbcC
MIEKIKLQNWKSHSETELQFKPGINVLVGPMGSGKSSVLQAICFALFGSVPEVKRREVKVSELVKLHSGSQAAVNIDIKIDDKAFHVERIINSKGAEATVRDVDGVMLAGTSPTQATAFLKNILKLDEDTFLRTVYAKQNEIDLFLQLNPQERKTRLDELIGVHKFEAARKNCVKLANQLQLKAETKANILKGLELEKVSQDVGNLQQEISFLDAESLGLGDKVIAAQAEKLNSESQLKELKVKFNEFTRLEEKQKLLIAQVNQIRLKLKDTVASSGELKSALAQLTAKIDYLDHHRAELNRRIDQSSKELMLTEKEASVADSRLADSLLQIEKISALKVELQQLSKQLNIAEPKTELENLENELKSTINEVASAESEVRLLKKHLEELKSAEGICPTCTRALEVETKDKLVSERENKITELIQISERLRSKRIELEVQKGKIQDFIDQENEFLRDISKESELFNQKSALTEKLDTCRQSLQTITGKIEQAKAELKENEEQTAKLHKDELELREQLHLAELKEQEQKLSDELKDVQATLATKPDAQLFDDAENNFRKVLQRYEELSAKQKSIEFIIEEKRKRLADLTKKQKQAEQIQVETAELQRKVEFLQQFRTSLLIAQEALRKELVSAVNELMSVLWNKLYPYEKWTSIQLNASDVDYILQLRTAEGDWIDVAGFASGGERMLAALVLRLAFAKILAPQFNILILDEPTHNLDDAAINTLMLALQEHLSEFLEQLFIVTHEEKLAEVGDNIIRLV